VGRFQPFHLGHLEAIKDILRKNEKVIIVIGSSQEKGTVKNPFSFKERKRMISESLESEGIRNFRIIGIRDFMDDKKWTSEIRKACYFDRVYSRNAWTIRCFRKAGIPVKKHPLFERGKYSATEIRRRLSRGGEWEALVPKKVARHIRKGVL
jgi:nicotinamide-nucleotide adenylyltransferase